MKVISLFAGVGGFDLGFERAGMEIVAHVEIDLKCRELLQMKWPDAVCLDDVRTAGRHNLPDADVICGGFPCQDLSVAGKRAGLDGGRSGLFYEMTRIVDELQPAFLIWENVPGLISSDSGKDLYRVLAELDRLGYHGGWRTLDAQYFGVAQRRRRVFGVFARRDIGAERCAEILSLAEGLRGHPAPSRAPRQRVAGTPTGGAGGRGWPDPSDGNGGGIVAPAEVSGTLSAKHAARPDRGDSEHNDQLVPEIAPTLAGGTGGGAGHQYRQNGNEDALVPEIAGTIDCGMAKMMNNQIANTPGHIIPEVTPPLAASGVGAGRTGNERNELDFCIPETTYWNGEDIADTLTRKGSDQRMPDKGQFQAVVEPGQHAARMAAFGEYVDDGTASTLKQRDYKDATDLVVEPVAFSCKDHGADSGEISPTLRSMSHDESHMNGGGQVAVAFQSYAVNPGDHVGEDVSRTLDVGKGGGMAVAIGFNGDQSEKTRSMGEAEDQAPTLRAGSPAHVALAFKPSHYTRDKDGAPSEVTPPLSADADKGDQDPVVLAPTLTSSNDPSRSPQSSEVTNQVGSVVEATLFSIMPQNSGKDYKARECDVTQPLMASGPTHGDQGGDVVLEATAFQPGNLTRRAGAEPNSEVAPTLGSSTQGDQAPHVATAMRESGQGFWMEDDKAGTLRAEGENRPSRPSNVAQIGAQVRRLTPREAERLQGFQWECGPDYPGAWQDERGRWWSPDWTAGFSDSVRYRMMGNAVCVNVAEWIGRRIMAAMADEGGDAQ